MIALQKRVIKSHIVDKLEEMDFSVWASDTPALVFFTDKPVNDRSKKMHNCDNPYCTSFGVKSALSFIQNG